MKPYGLQFLQSIRFFVFPLRDVQSKGAEIATALRASQ